MTWCVVFDIVKSRIAPSATVTKVTGVALSPSVDGCLERSAENALRRDGGANANWRRDVKSHQRFCRLLDRTPSGRSEDKLVFLINTQLETSFARTQVLATRFRPLPSGMGIDDESDQVP